MHNKYSSFIQHLSIIEGSRCDWSTKMAVFFPTKVEIKNLWVGSKAHLRKLLSPRAAWDSRILPARRWSKNQTTTMHSFYEVHLAAVHRGSPSTWNSQARQRARSPSYLSSSPRPCCPPKPPRCPPANIAESLPRVSLCAQTFACNVISASPINDLSFMTHLQSLKKIVARLEHLPGTPRACRGCQNPPSEKAPYRAEPLSPPSRGSRQGPARIRSVNFHAII